MLAGEDRPHHEVVVGGRQPHLILACLGRGEVLWVVSHQTPSRIEVLGIAHQHLRENSLRAFPPLL